MGERSIIVSGSRTWGRAHLTYDHRRDGLADVALCSARIPNPRLLVVQPPTGREMCSECVRLDMPATTPSRDSGHADLSPSVSVQHRCPRMREHLPSDGMGRPGERDGLPVPCPDCYSIVVTTIRVPWQPSWEFTITEGK